MKSDASVVWGSRQAYGLPQHFPLIVPDYCVCWGTFE